jgi:hypothetical protein
MSTNKKNIAQLAFRFVLIIGIVNLFADFTYEGGAASLGRSSPRLERAEQLSVSWRALVN